MAKPGPKLFSGKYSSKIAALRPRKEIYFKGAEPDSIKAIAHRAGKATGRIFSTRRENGGTWVYREA